MKEFWAIVAPSPVGPMSVVTKDGGSQEVTRVYFDSEHRNGDAVGPAIEMGDGWGRSCAGHKPVALSYRKDRGLDVEMTEGYRLFIPVGLLRVTYRL